MAKEAKISVVFLQGIEARKKWISPSTVEMIAKALEVPESQLFENCLHDKKSQLKRLSKPKFDHVPDDVFNALATTCQKEAWKWEVFRWILQGFERENFIVRL